MIPRYSRKEMSRIWEPESKFSKWLEIEILVCEALETSGEIPEGTTKKIREKENTKRRMKKRETTVKKPLEKK